MSEEELESNQISEQELEDIPGGATLVTYGQDQNKNKFIRRIYLDENTYKFLKKRGYEVYRRGDDFDFLPCGDDDTPAGKRKIVDVLKKNDFKIYESVEE